MKVGNSIGSMFKLIGGNPGKFFAGILISCPSDIVEERAPAEAFVDLGIHNFGNLVLDVVVDFNWRRGWLDPVGNSIWRCGF